MKKIVKKISAFLGTWWKAIIGFFGVLLGFFIFKKSYFYSTKNRKVSRAEKAKKDKEDEIKEVDSAVLVDTAHNRDDLYTAVDAIKENAAANINARLNSEL